MLPTRLAALDSGAVVTGRSPWREVFGLSLLVPLGIACILPDDPLMLEGRFPWVTLVPLLIGAQHGALAAAVSSVLLVGLGALHVELNGQGSFASLGAFAAGCFAVGTIAGASRDRIHAQLARLAGRAADESRRLSRLARAHSVLALSHGRLEERLAARSWSLASAFEDARRALGALSAPSAVGDLVLNVLSNHALVQSATLLTFISEGDEGDGAAALGVCATLGNAPAAELDHRLVRRALETRRLVALDAESADGSDETILAVVPLCAASGHLLGLVLIHEMPFMAFEAEGLNGLAALVALLADMLEDQFIDARSETDLEALFAPPMERGRRPMPSLDTPHEPVAPEARHFGDPASIDFLGSRTGTHRRRGVAQSA
jgi:polysaccharide biosynthesis protein PelD